MQQRLENPAFSPSKGLIHFLTYLNTMSLKDDDSSECDEIAHPEHVVFHCRMEILHNEVLLPTPNSLASKI